MSELKTQVIDIESEQILFECDSTESDKAYSFASEMEKYGAQVKVIQPTLGETFKNALNLSNEQESEFDESLKEELEDHDGQEIDSCCFKPFESN